MDFTTKITELNPELHRWFLIPVVRILIVTDGNIDLSETADFGLGKVIKTLETENFYSNVRFCISGASRAGSQNSFPGASSKQFKYTGFKFTMSGFDINDYHQVWFFGFDPGNDGSSNDANINNSANPLKDAAEIAVLSNWMNARKGGVLAMGDHHYLGASLCSKIPRVRKMRRWTNADQVPSISGPDRHDTNQDKTGSGVIPFNAQSDDVPQKIEVLKKRYSRYFFLTSSAPHPILCGADGAIDIFPDHPHEGEVLGVRYDTGYGGTPVNLSGEYPAGVAEFPDSITGAAKPQPQILAFGHPVNNPRHDKNQAYNTKNPGHTNSTTPFGLVSAYDGENAGVGRIVADSTWHHWFNINLRGFDAPATASTYRKIQNYFTNVAVWLCRENLRNSILHTWIWQFLVKEFDPMRFSVTDSIWRLGKEARDVLGRSASQCATLEWTRIYFPDLVEVVYQPEKSPCLTCPPIDVFEIALLGGMMKELLPLVEKYRLTEKFERQPLDIEQINKAMYTGVYRGYDELMVTLKESIGRTTQLFDLAQRTFLQKDFKLDVELNTKKIRVELEAILFNSPLLSRLIAERKETYISISVSDAFKRINVRPINIYLNDYPTKESGIYYKINKVILEDVFQDGESLKIEYYLNDEHYRERNKLYETILSGDVASWTGAQIPVVNTLAQENVPVVMWINVSESADVSARG